MFLVFDTETTGLPHWKTPSDDSAQPHIVQLAALLVDPATYEIKNRLNVVVKPEGWSWTDTDEAYLTHGVTMEYALENGIPEETVLDACLDMWKKSKFRIAHNATFDNRIIRIALKRYKPELLEEWKESDYRCTGLLSKNILKMPGKGKGSVGKYKMPKLTEAYEHFTGKKLKGAHDAMNDTLACLEVYKGIKAYKPNKAEAKKMHNLDLESVLDFGKNKGKQVEDLIGDDPSYIAWLIENNVALFDEEAMEAITKAGIA